MSEVTVISAPAPCTLEEMRRRTAPVLPDAAVDDLRHARYAEEGGFHSHACFSSQQAAEKPSRRFTTPAVQERLWATASGT